MQIRILDKYKTICNLDLRIRTNPGVLEAYILVCQRIEWNTDQDSTL